MNQYKIIFFPKYMRTIFYIYKPGFAKKWGTLEELADKLTGGYKDYELFITDNTIDMVHKDYKKYVVRVLDRRNPYFPIVQTLYNKKDADTYIKECKKRYSKRLIELATADWKNTLSDYKWFKKINITTINSKALSNRRII